MKLAFLMLIFLNGEPESKTSLVSMRNLYYRASQKTASADTMAKILADDRDLSITMKGYRAMSLMFKANYSWNPYNKLDYFLKGKNILEDAIAKEKENVELRFLRFCVQTNAPAFLGYSSMIESDKKAIIRYWKDLQDEDLKRRISEYMLTSKSCTKMEKEIFR